VSHLIPKSEADRFSDVQIGEQVRTVIAQWFHSTDKSNLKVADDVKDLFEGFKTISVEKVERADEPGEDRFGCPGFDCEEETGGAA
jgi:hypothetical protein